MQRNKQNVPVEIFAGSPMEAEIVRSMLTDSGIEAFLKDENMGTIAPWHVSAGGAGAVKVIISNADYDKAKSVVEEYYKNMDSDSR